MHKSVTHLIHSALSLLVLTALFTGCNQYENISEEEREKAVADQGKALNEIMEKVADTSGETLKEFQKLRQLQYNVITLDADNNDEQMQTALNKLGEEGWDCYSTNYKSETEQLQMFCKRRTDTPLRFLPHFAR